MQGKFIELTIQEAKKAAKQGEVPIGCIIVKNNKIISKAHNMVESKKDATMHGEMIAIKKAGKKLKNWRLLDCEMYVTLEPCNMCMNAIELSRIKKVYYLIKKSRDININDKKYEYTVSIYNVEEDVCVIEIYCNDELVMRVVDRASDDPLDPAVG